MYAHSYTHDAHCILSADSILKAQRIVLVRLLIFWLLTRYHLVETILSSLSATKRLGEGGSRKEAFTSLLLLQLVNFLCIFISFKFHFI